MGDTMHLHGRPTADVLANTREKHEVLGVSFPGDVGLFVRDTVPTGETADDVPEPYATWRCPESDLLVTVSPAGPTDSDVRWVCDLRRWSDEKRQYVHESTIHATSRLAFLPSVVVAALRRVDTPGGSAAESLREFAAATDTPTVNAGWWDE